MISLIKKELKLTRKILLIWLGIIILLCVFAYIEYLSLKDSLPILVEMLNDFPRILMVMFGVSKILTLHWVGMAVFIFGWQSSLIPMRFIWAFQALQKKKRKEQQNTYSQNL